MYYRVAIRADGGTVWRWKSTVLSSLDTLFQFLRLFRALPQDRLRVFSSSSREDLAEQLEQENRGLSSRSVTAGQFLSERLLCPPALSSTPEGEGETSLERRTVLVIGQQAANNGSARESILKRRSISILERRREELESGPGGDHDVPYCFNFPLALSEVRAWMAILARVRKGELHP